MNTELLRKVTKVHTSDGVYDGSMCHEAADEIKRLRGAINRAVCSMHVDCDTGFLCLSDFDFWELKMAVKGK